MPLCIRKLVFTVLVFTLTLLQALPAFANEDTEPSIPALLERAREAEGKGDDEAVGAILEQIHLRVTGFPPGIEAPPEGVSDEDFVAKICAYSRLEAPLYSSEDLERLRLFGKLWGFMVVFKGDKHEALVRSETECRSMDGALLPTSRLIADSIAWAKRFQAASSLQQLEMAREIETLADQHPDNPWVQGLWNLVSFRAEEARRALREKDEAARPKTEAEILLGLSNNLSRLAWEGGMGDLDAQLELATTLEKAEIGDPQSNKAAAYLWYQRAYNNGGRQEARAGMDRLCPGLDATDLGLIHLWSYLGSFPY